MSSQPLKPLPPTETLELPNTLTLIPRVKLLLTIFRSDLSVKPIDEWKLKRSLLDFLANSLSSSIPDEDLEIHKFKDLKKRKREDPVASGSLCVRDLGFLTKKRKKSDEDEKVDLRILEKKFFDWRNSFVKRLDGIELSIEGAKFRLDAVVPVFDDFDGLKKSWEEFYAFSSGRGSSSRSEREPDTLIVRGLPSRWFAETRVSSKPSMLVTHTIFSALGKIRKIDVAEDDDLGKNAEEGSEDLISGLQCKIVVQFEKHDDFSNAMKMLCGRSMQKQGSRLKADYEATWDKDDFFRNSYQRATINRIDESSRSYATSGWYKSEASSHQRDAAYSKRFKD